VSIAQGFDSLTFQQVIGRLSTPITPTTFSTGHLKKAIEMGLEKKEWNPPQPSDLDKLLAEICPWSN